MKLIYVAGAYNAPTAWEVERNIWRAREAGARIVQCGAYPVIPHANTGHFGGLADESLFYAGTLALLERCDAVLMLQGWESSKGATGERNRAVELGMRRFYATPTGWYQLREWAQQ